MNGVVRAQWRIEDPELFTPLSVNIARRELRDITDRLQVTLVGPPKFRTRRGYLVCEAPAIRRISSQANGRAPTMAFADPRPCDVGDAPVVDDGADDGVDEEVVERALAGQSVTLTDAELVAALRAGVARGLTLSRLANQLGVNYSGARRMLGGGYTPRRELQQRVEAEVARIGHKYTDHTLGALLGVHHQTVTRARARLARRAGQVAS